MSCNVNSTQARLIDGGIPNTLAINLPLFAILMLIFSWLHRRNSSPATASSSSSSRPGIKSPLLDGAATGTPYTAGNTASLPESAPGVRSDGGQVAAQPELHPQEQQLAATLPPVPSSPHPPGTLLSLQARPSFPFPPVQPENAAASAKRKKRHGKEPDQEQRLLDAEDAEDPEDPEDPESAAFMTRADEANDMNHFFQQRGFVSWIVPLLKINDTEMSKKAGIDAVHYLVFQKTLFYLLCAMGCLSLAVVLPINYTGSEDYEGFSATTISNIPSGSKSLWVHVIFTGLYSFATYYTLSRFSSFVHRTRRQWKIEVSDTIMITNIPLEMNNPSILVEHFAWAYPEGTIVDVKLAYDVGTLSSLYAELKQTRYKLERAEALQQKHGEPTFVSVPWLCGDSVDAVQHYSARVRNIEAQIEIQRRNLQPAPSGIAFVTFSPPSICSTIVEQHATGWPRTSMHSPLLRPSSWFVEKAPSPSDVIWTSLSIGSFTWWVRFLIINALLFMFLLFFTTPISILSSLRRLSETEAFSNISSSISQSTFLTNYLPTLLLWIFALLLPMLVSYSARLEAHKMRSDLDRSTARKVFIYLIVSILILPSFLLTSADAFIEVTLRTNESIVDKIECVFLPDNGALFVNYLLMSTFLGIPFEMLHLIPFLIFKWRLWRAVTKSEVARAKRLSAAFFNYGEQYARLVAIFSVVLVFSTTCPVIVVVGIVYFGLKHISDKYNLCFVHRPTYTSNGLLVKSAINFALGSVLIFEAIVLGFFVLKVGISSPLSVVVLLCLEATVVLCALKFFKVSFYPLVGFKPPSQQENEEIKQWQQQQQQQEQQHQHHQHQERSADGRLAVPVEDPENAFDLNAAFADSDEEEEFIEEQKRRRDEALRKQSHGSSRPSTSQTLDVTIPLDTAGKRRPYVPPFMLDWDELHLDLSSREATQSSESSARVV